MADSQMDYGLFSQLATQALMGQEQIQQQQDIQTSQQSPVQYGLMNSIQTGRNLGRAGQGMMGAEDPTLQKMAQLKQIDQIMMQSNIDPSTDPESFYKMYSHVLRQAGFYNFAMQAATMARKGKEELLKMQKQEADIDQTKALTDQATATAEKTRLEKKIAEGKYPHEINKMKEELTHTIQQANKLKSDIFWQDRLGPVNQSLKNAEVRLKNAEADEKTKQAAFLDLRKIVGGFYQQELTNLDEEFKDKNLTDPTIFQQYRERKLALMDQLQKLITPPVTLQGVIGQQMQTNQPSSPIGDPGKLPPGKATPPAAKESEADRARKLLESMKKK